jgi:hypothetical protein
MTEADVNYGDPCTDLLECIERQELSRLRSTHVLGEVAHRLIAIEASLLFSRPFAGMLMGRLFLLGLRYPPQSRFLGRSGCGILHTVIAQTPSGPKP